MKRRKLCLKGKSKVHLLSQQLHCICDWQYLCLKSKVGYKEERELHIKCVKSGVCVFIELDVLLSKDVM